MVTVRIADCCDVLCDPANHQRFDAGVTDLPYGIGMHRQSWDETGLAVSQELWTGLYHSLKPGAYMATLCAADQYH